MIRLNKSYDTISFLLISITLMMLILAINILLISENIIIAKADSQTNNNLDTANGGQLFSKKNFYIYFVSKSMTMLEMNYKENNKNSSENLITYVINKLFKFDYKNPKSYLGAVPLMKEVERDIVEVSQDNYLYNSEDYDTREIFIAERDNSDSFQTFNEASEKYYSNTNNDDIIIINDKTNESNYYNITDDNIEIISTPAPTPKKIKHDMNKPLICIYHTHGTESYKPESVGNYHSLNREFTVIKIGEELKKKLESRGYKVIHDDTIHDYPSYQGSYQRSLATLNKNLSKYPSLKIVFDIHRDGINQVDDLENYEEIRSVSCAQVNGQRVARYAFVVGTANENAEELKRFAYYMKAVSDELYPGLARPVILKKYKYNQYKSDYYALIEIGSNANTIEESIRSVQYIADVIDKSLRGFINKE